MIRIQSYKNKNDDFVGFHVEGHADYDEFGKDIVCSAISVLAINTINSIEAFTEDRFEIQTDDKIGLIDFRIITEVSDNSKLLLNSMFLGLQMISDSYGSEYVEMKFEGGASS